MRRFLSLLHRKILRQERLDATSSAESQPTSGLLVIQIKASTADSAARLRVHLGGGHEPVFEKALASSDGDQSFWIALHGQLLPDGPAAIRLELIGGHGELLAHRDMTLLVRNLGELGRQVRESLEANGAPLVVEGACDSSFYDYADPKLTAWFDRGPAEVEAHLSGLTASGAASVEEIEALRHFVENGFLVMPDAVNADQLARINEAVDEAVASKTEGYEWGSSQRIHNLHLQHPAIKELWLHPKILRMLGLIFGAPARPCQSLTYVFGSQQEHHQDTIHLTPFPAGRMCGVWTALEDVQPDSGELLVFPGSHRLPRIYMDSCGLPKVRGDDWTAFQGKVVARWTDMLNEGGFAPEAYRPKAGAILIWHENLMHAGSQRKDLSKSRRSIVGHYFAQGAVVYYDSSGLPGGLYEGEVA